MPRTLWTIFTLLVAAASPAAAGMITGATVFPGPNQGFGPGLGFVSVPVINTPNPDNDNQPGGPGGDNNVTVPLKRFDNVGYIDIEFLVADSPGNRVTEYRVSESVDNDTGFNWIGYRMELGFGVGDNFKPSTAGDGLDFDFPDYDSAPSSSAFALVDTTINEDTLLFTGGVHGLPLENYTVRIDVPDLAGGRFTLRQTPIVPEPSSLALLALGAMTAIATSWRQRLI